MSRFCISGHRIVKILRIPMTLIDFHSIFIDFHAFGGAQGVPASEQLTYRTLPPDPQESKTSRIVRIPRSPGVPESDYH